MWQDLRLITVLRPAVHTEQSMTEMQNGLGLRLTRFYLYGIVKLRSHIITNEILSCGFNPFVNGDSVETFAFQI